MPQSFFLNPYSCIAVLLPVTLPVYPLGYSNIALPVPRRGQWLSASYKCAPCAYQSREFYWYELVLPEHQMSSCKTFPETRTRGSSKFVSNVSIQFLTAFLLGAVQATNRLFYCDFKHCVRTCKVQNLV